MVRRSLGVALWSLAGLLACFLGALSALVGTGAGRGLISRLAERAVADALAGTIEVGEVRGGLITGVTLTDVRIYDDDTTLVAWLPRAELSYNPFDFAAGRVVLLGLRLDHPLINLVQHPDGRLNLEALLRLGGRPDSGPRRPAPLVVFRDVRIRDGSFVLRLRDRPSPGDSLLEVGDHGPQGRLRVRRFDQLNARLAALRLSSPRDRGIRLDIEALAFDATDPAVRVTDARGRVVVVGDSLEAALDRVSLPGSRLSARGRVRWPRDTLLYDLDLRVDSATLTDFRFIDRRYPGGAILRGAVALRSRGARVLEVTLDPLNIGFHGGSLQGRVRAVSAAGQGLVAVRQADLTASELDLGLVRPFLDTLPFAGRLSGHTVADGRLEELAIETDWTFRDSLVAGWPVTRIRGRGEVDLAGPDGIHFQPFSLEAATVDLGTARRLFPALGLRGTLDAAGTLTGPYRAAEFSGTLRHREGDRPASVVRGVVQLDAREDALGVYVDVATDSLSWDGLRGSFPGLPLTGTAAGTIRLSGTQDALETHFALAADGGGLVRGDGVLTLRAPRYAARDFTFQAVDADLRRWIPQAPTSRLAATLVGSAAVDSGTPAVGRIEVALAPSILAGTVLDSGAALVRLAEGRLLLDSLRLAQPGMVTTGSGSLSLRRDGADGELRAGNGPVDGEALTLVFHAESLSSLDSLVGWVAGLRTTAGAHAEGAGGEGGLRGTARVAVTLSGALDSLALAVRAEGEQVRWRGWALPRGRARLEYAPGPTSAFDLDVMLDSLGRDEMGFGAVSARARGRVDSLTWFARSRVGDLGAFLAGGRFARREAGRALAVGIDSLALLLPGGVWFLEEPASFVLGDSTARLEGFAVRNARGPGRLTLGGDLPVRGRANANLHLEAFPLAGLYALLQRDTVGVGGALTATFGMAGTRGDPVYRGAFALSDGSLGKFRIPFLDGNAEYRERRLDGSVHLWRSGQQILALTTHLPLDLSLAEVAERQLPDTLSVRAQADSVDLSVLEAVMPLVRDVRGHFSADARVRGTWDAPSLEGSVRIDNAGAFIPTLNVRYDGVDGRFALSGDTVRVEALTARGDKGTARVTGVVRLERLTRPVLDLSIAADQFKALDLRGYLSLTASGQLRLMGPVIGATLTGRGTVTSGVLHFADLVTKRVVNLDEPWVASLIDTSLIRRERLGPEFESVFFDSLRIRGLDLAMGSDVWLRSTEANIQLSGTVTVSKEGDAYRLTGTLQAPRGTYRIVAPVTREFVVTQGTVRYFGTPDLDAALDIQARHVVHPVPTRTGDNPDDLTIIARIRGTLLVPRLTLEAEGRQLSQTEIISYLLFGLPSVELAGEPGAGGRGSVLSSAITRFGLAGLSGELERTLVSDLGVPLDYLEVEFRSGNDPASVSGARLAAGWQIGRKTFLVLNAGFCPQERLNVGQALGASLQFRISPEWRTEASFEPVTSCGGVPGQAALRDIRQLGLDLFWERRY